MTKHQLTGIRATAVALFMLNVLGNLDMYGLRPSWQSKSVAFSAPARSRGALLRQVAALAPGVGVVSAPWQAVLAEEAASSLPPLKPIRSRAGFEMQVPKNWQSFTDRDPEKLLFAFDFYQSNFEDYMAMRAEQIDMSTLLKGERYIPSEQDKVASAWSIVIQPPITPEQMATWIMRHSSISEQTPGATLQGRGGQDVTEGPGKTDTIVDAVLPDGGKDHGDEGSELLFHVRTTLTPVDGAAPPARYWVNKALLRNGTITVGYVTAIEKHWLPGGSPMDGAYLDSVAKTLRFV